MAYIVGITGPSGSGKSTLARGLHTLLGEDQAVLLVQDDYYRDLKHLPLADRTGVDFDDPAAVELELLAAHLSTLHAGRPVQCPVYDFAAHTRVCGAEKLINPKPVILVEGLLLAGEKEVREQLDLLVYVEAPAHVRLHRRISRDVVERGRTKESVAEQWDRDVEPAAQRFIYPVKEFADLIVDGSTNLEDAIATVRGRLKV